jgi:CO/xanthine dehydrogenase Mo-binding subunit
MAHEAGKSGADRKWVGQPIQRKEEDRLVRGKGKFVDDFKPDRCLFMCLARSPYAHASVDRIDISAAAAVPGVAAILTGDEVATLCSAFFPIGPGSCARIVDLPMAHKKVLYQGEPVVAIAAESPRIAEDAAELVQVDYTPLEPVIDIEAAITSKSLLHEAAGSNVIWNGEWEFGDMEKAFREAAHVVHIDHLHFHRFSSTPLENNAIVAEWDLKDNHIEYICNNSFPTIGLQMLAPALGVRMDQIRCQTHDIGGSFGIKINNYVYMALAALLSRKAGGRPIKWAETRSEHMVASAHGNERVFRDTRVALDQDGVITAIASRYIDDCGAYPRYEPLGCVIWSQVFCGTYRFRNAKFNFTQVVTNKCPVGPNRGYSRMQHLWFLERVIDICAHELGIPADVMRLRNYIRPEEFPYTTPNGCIYDSGSYARMLEMAKKLIDYDGWRQKQAAARQQGRLLGIGIGTTLDSGTNNFGQARIVNPDAPFSGNSQAANVKLDMYGEIVVAVGSVPQGQGHETVAAQVVADVLHVHPDLVAVRTGFDTDRNVHTGFTGTYASQFAVSGLSAVHGAAQKLKKEILRLAAFMLQAKEADLELGLGGQGPEVRVRGTDKSISFMGLANIVNVNSAAMPEELYEITLNCRYTWRAPFKVPDIGRKYGNLTLTYSAQLHIVVVEIDRDTYDPKLLDYVAIDDCGTVINPRIVEGQVHGAAAHGIGAALMESCVYDATGNMLTATFSDYTPITSVNIPRIKYGFIETPSPHTYSGAKGMGEGGAAPLHAISAALQDALFDQGIIIDDSHNTANSIFQAVQAARAGQLKPNVEVQPRGRTA